MVVKSSEKHIESDSKKGLFYNVDTIKLTCNCPYFTRELSSFPLDDPNRICKHLAQALAGTQIPENLINYKDDILWCASNKVSFAAKDKSIKRRKIELPEGSVKTVSVNRKKKYCYVDGLLGDKNISATIPLTGGLVNYSINKYHAHYNTQTQESNISINYRNLEQAIVNWIVDEYNKVKNDSAPIAKKKEIKYQPIETEYPEGSVKTVSLQKKDGMIEFYGELDNFEEEEYYHLYGEIGREKIEAIIRKGYHILLFSINGSKVYSYSGDFESQFPKSYWFIEKAVIHWLKDEYNKIESE